MSHEDPQQEASDAATDPARLRQLARHEDWAVRQATWRNPSVPEDVWREALLRGYPEAWANPMAPIYLLTWTPHKEDWRTLGEAAGSATYQLWETPDRISFEGKALLNAKVQEWWATSQLASDMMTFLGWWTKMKANGSSEHREVVRILVSCLQTAPNLTEEDRQAIDLLEAWTAGGEDRWEKIEALASFSWGIKAVCRFALDPSNNRMKDAIREVLRSGESTSKKQVQAEHERMLADVIRGEMPLPPVVD